MTSRARRVAFVVAAADGCTLIVNRFDRYHADFGVGLEILEEGAYGVEEGLLGTELLSQCRAIRGDAVVAIDCGANIGVHTIRWARHMTAWGSVAAIEAQERVFYALAGNIALNNCFNARAIWAAVAESGGTMMIPQLDHQAAASFGSLELRRRTLEAIGQNVSYEENDLTPVRALTLDSLELPRVDLIKLDIEGMEIDALRGARRTLAGTAPILMVEHVKVGKDSLLSALEPLGYDICGFDAMNLYAVKRGSDLDVDAVRAVLKRDVNASPQTSSTRCVI